MSTPGYETLTRKVKSFRENLSTRTKNDKTWLLYESVNELSEEDLKDLGLTIVDLAEIVSNEIDQNPFTLKKEHLVH
ncbi:MULTISPECIES: hypothetical protein [Bacillus]|uniref:Uncharacterized protein n=1 Tax=Bacillus subtilis subsp. subtilis NCIB 3610 = ATCC 6051 = DSM 10 TaxID=535026 RepID=S5DW33_BACIU|nr:MULTISPECIES: hypothetical protein [Bacillus]AGQ21279.1 unknown [Bacillus subtilis subsp. subtilis NCIB 3610 = ATCC 6051 = DSM 10]AQZ93191.1 hypothetical protein B4U62_22315 [Bacillus subtilis]AXF35608.1 hypothetical protein DS740_22310 [Bacillus sp. DM2]KNB75925.1 hypothetical protein ACR57_21050 [Bacillus subtilis]MBA4562897.1 hypothetical protein [Bacillus subtilis subsp. subtilis]